ncbi:MAG: HAD family hydrolase [Peptococcaceae bacterium]|nr:MAG: HAD family hydrolase [Peptococcaceae bacterium]
MRYPILSEAKRYFYRDCRLSVIARSEATKQSYKSGASKEIATLPAVARNDKVGDSYNAEKTGCRAVFLDRDGVINALVYDSDHGTVDSPHCPGQFVLLPAAAAGIKLLNRLGFLVVVVSNQPGVAKGKTTPALLRAVTEKMERGLAARGARLDGVFYCLHHPEAALKEYRKKCSCRKPAPGLILEAARELDINPDRSWMIGDGLTDVKAGRDAGCKTILVGRFKCDLCRYMEGEDARPDYMAADLLAAARLICEGERNILNGNFH